jgi:hypothetical protein
MYLVKTYCSGDAASASLTVLTTGSRDSLTGSLYLTLLLPLLPLLLLPKVVLGIAAELYCDLLL